MWTIHTRIFAETRNLKHAAGIEPRSVMLVVALDVLHIPGAQEVRERLEFNIRGVACVIQG